ncbi:N-6 DNA methylase, partial [Patescibacteria group bacterium]|nr:N-6 DNA methylase [Patescibacteria group bacterium]
MASKDPIETYFKELQEIRSTGGGTRETSYYAPLENLLNALGGKLKPKVRAISQLANAGAGHPDYGLYTQSQFQKARDEEPLPGQNPERGVIEAKPTDDDSWVTAKGKQVSKYWGKYRQVLVTNYRDFVLIGQDADGNPVKLETLRLAESEKDFWLKTRQPRKFAKEVGERFADYLVRVLKYSAPLTSPQDLAWFLASYAREARYRVEDAGLEALDPIKKALEQTLGLEFSGDRGEHFFRSTLVQTLFYGLFSAWVLWSQEHPPADKKARFRWKEAMWTLHVPMIQALFERVATPSKLKPLDLVELLDWTETALNRVDRASFFSVFDQGQAVQYFYEPFLEAFDPKLRKELGVWYTPSEIVRYMVARVDQVLKSELGLKDGLADSQVYVLDPCCGTGAYLAEVIRTIEKTLRNKGGDDLVAYDLKKAATERVFGFEILTAPFVVAHMQIGLLLQQAGAPLATDGNERAGVYLTNALTGWEPPKEPKDRLPFPEFEQEREAADRVKQETPILVILGNPPYNAFAGTSPAEEQGLVDVYKEGLNKPVKDGGWGIKKFNLDELYVRFFRLAQRRIAEVTGKGVVCFISNFSYIGDPSFVVMRKKILEDFDNIWIDCLNGDSRETGKLTPE